MFLEQKPKTTDAAISKLILAAVILICFSTVLGVAEYIFEIKPELNRKQLVYIEPAVTAMPTPVVKDEMADWKTYSNEKYGFEVKYPKDWFAEERIGDKVMNPGITIFELELGDTKTDKNKRSQISIKIEGDNFMLGTRNWEDFKSGQVKGRITCEEQGSCEIILDPLKIPVSVTTYITTMKNPSLDSLIGKILFTFKFIEKDSSFSCGTSTVKDIDNNVYNTVKIGEQCWLKENLKVIKNPEGKAIIRYCYDNDPKICETDGGLYDWNTAMNNSTIEGAQGICPNGWHVPKDSEWYILEKGLATDSCSADRNGSDCYPVAMKLEQNGSSGFDALFAGSYNSVSFGLRGTAVIFWSSTENKTLARSRSFYISNTYPVLKGKISRSSGSKIAGFSLRCLRD